MDTLIATAIAVTSHALFFLAGLIVANHYNDKSLADTKDALERQFLRLQAHADADDPCKPYKANSKCGVWLPAPVVAPREFGEPEDVLPQQFEDTLKTTGQATALLKNKRNSKQADITSA